MVVLPQGACVGACPGRARPAFRIRHDSLPACLHHHACTCVTCVPPGTVLPPDPLTSPLTVLNGSSGFNADDLKVSLGDGQTPAGDPFQALALDFGAGGLAPGWQLLFSMNRSPT